MAKSPSIKYSEINLELFLALAKIIYPNIVWGISKDESGFAVVHSSLLGDFNPYKDFADAYDLQGFLEDSGWTLMSIKLAPDRRIYSASHSLSYGLVQDECREMRNIKCASAQLGIPFEIR